MRALWGGSISLGLINIPVKLYSASETVRVSAHNKKDEAPIRYAKICTEETIEVECKDVVKA